MTIRRRSTIAKRITKIKGLPPAEKHLLERIGTLVDAQINNRTISNPTGTGRIKVDPRLPPPRLITAESGIKSTKISWPAVDSSILSHYELTITSVNVEEPQEEILISYTNTFFYRGRPGGSYKAKVRSVGRNGTKSPVLEEVEFFIQDNLMDLQGTKNDFNVVGTIVVEDLFLVEQNKIYVWGACVIDKLIGGVAVGNPELSLRLYKGPTGTGFANATFIEEIPLFDATESATNLDNTALGGGVFRPALQPPADLDPAFVRGSTFETSYGVMFSPLDVDPSEDQKIFDFYVVAIGREVPDDVINLSITVWSAPVGDADSIPALPTTIEPPIAFPWFRCISLNEDLNVIGTTLPLPADPITHGLDWLHNTGIADGRRLFGSTWTWAAWIKPRRFSGAAQSGEVPTNGRIFALTNVIPSKPSAYGMESGYVNGFEVRAANRLGGFGRIQTAITVWDKGNASGASTGFSRSVYIDPMSVTMATEFSDPIYTAPTTNPVWALGINEWHLLVITFDNSSGPVLYVNGTQKTRNATFSGETGGFTGQDIAPTNDLVYHSGGQMESTSAVTPPVNALWVDAVFYEPFDGLKLDFAADILIYAAGIWSFKLEQADAIELYNGGDGWERNWRQNIGDYNKAQFLAHYWQMGAEISEIRWYARDTGYYLGESGGFSGRANMSDEGVRPTIMSEDRNIRSDFPT